MPSKFLHIETGFAAAAVLLLLKTDGSADGLGGNSVGITVRHGRIVKKTCADGFQIACIIQRQIAVFIKRQTGVRSINRIVYITVLNNKIPHIFWRSTINFFPSRFAVVLLP